MRDYQAIFDRRGRLYHQAMTRFPRVRLEELSLVVDLAQPTSGERLVDVPSGGAYLQGLLPPEVELTAVETSRSFFEVARRRCRSVLAVSMTDIPLPSACADSVLSLAGLHHELARGAIYTELKRLLVPGGRLVIAEVQQDTPVARFLNEFVDRHGEGHQGMFFDVRETHQQLAEAGFHVEHCQLHRPYWRAASARELAEFASQLFALRAEVEVVERGLSQYLGFESQRQQCLLPWELLAVVARRS